MNRTMTPGVPLPTAARWSDALPNERRLARFGVAMAVLALLFALAALVDDRTLRGVDVWIKPIKFAMSIGVLSLTTAWFAGHLPASVRAGRPMDRIVWLVVGTATFELAYIELQAALGQGSHYNVGDPLHATMYSLMGLGALVLTATQPMLAWLLWRHPDASRPPAFREAILIGLVLTFVLGAGIGGVLAGRQPASGDAVVPWFGWSLHGGDLRPAHFVGIHAEQALPLVGYAVSRAGFRHARAAVWVSALGYVSCFALLVAWGLVGRA